MTKYPKGSYIKNGDDRRKVLEELGDLRFLSSSEDDGADYGLYLTVKELESKGWKQEEEWPKKGDRYWCVSKLGHLVEHTWFNDSTDLPTRDFMGVFCTRKEAEERLEKIKGFVKTLK